MDLYELSGEALRPLHQLILSRAVGSSADGSFASFTPDIRLYLFNNALRTLPSELWRLGNITVLTVRNNELAEVPEFVGQLKRLQELNVGGNNIHWLPWELLDLLSNDSRPLRLIVDPNPLIQPVDEEAIQEKRNGEARENLQSCQVLRGMLQRVRAARQERITNGEALSIPAYAGASNVTYFDVDGSTIHSLSASFSSTFAAPNYSAIIDRPSPPPTQGSCAPSLFELAARSCLDSPFLRQLPSLLPYDTPSPISAVLHKASRLKELGVPQCSVCNKSYVIKRAEWMEYWACNLETGVSLANRPFLPFMRRACSWGCAERVASERLQSDRSSRTL